MKGFIKFILTALKWFIYLTIFVVAMGTIFGERAPTEEEIKNETDKMYEDARSMPSSDACGNLEKYQELATLEKSNGTSYYTAIYVKKIKDYAAKCDDGRLMKQLFTSEEDKLLRIPRNDYLAAFENTYLACGNSKIVNLSVQRSQPLYILTGNYYDNSGRFSRKPSNTYKDEEVIIRIAKNTDKNITFYETYEQSTIDGSITNYRYGESGVSLKKYEVGLWNLSRDTLLITRIGSQQVAGSHSRIGDFHVEWFFDTQMSCETFSTNNLLQHIKERGEKLNETTNLKKKNSEIEKQKKQQVKEEAQRKANKL
jgi:hypothetical protein